MITKKDRELMKKAKELAAEEYLDKNPFAPIYDTFIAGANWQASQFKKGEGKEETNPITFYIPAFTGGNCKNCGKPQSEHHPTLLTCNYTV